MAVKVYYSNGKLLLTGEYLVLDGAKALAVPTNKGQYLTVKQIDEPKLVWKSFDENNSVWFEAEYQLENLKQSITNCDISKTLVEIITAAQLLNPDFLSGRGGYYVTTKLTFNRAFGLGSSSTLIANIAKWASIDLYKLLWNSFKGSGYDLACATSTTALIYQLDELSPKLSKVKFNPSFKDHLYFVYLNKKQSSKDGIQHYNALPDAIKATAILKVNEITSALLTCESLSNFEQLIELHEATLSEVLQLTTVKELLFKDYKGTVKSLGAWGGDFVLVTAKDRLDLDYFKAKGYEAIFDFQEMLLG